MEPQCPPRPCSLAHGIRKWNGNSGVHGAKIKRELPGRYGLETLAGQSLDAAIPRHRALLNPAGRSHLPAAGMFPGRALSLGDAATHRNRRLQCNKHHQRDDELA
jgi:hypothetical protein